MNKKYIVSLIVVAIIAIIALGVSFTVEGTPGPQGPKGEQGIAGKNGRDGQDAPVKLTANPGPDRFNNRECANGVCTWFYSTSVKPTGSTTCSFRLPNATTSNAFASAWFSRVSSTTVAEIGYSENSPNATTTLLSGTGAVIVASASGNIVSSSTAQHMLLRPNAYVNVKIGAGDTAGTVTPTGTCKLQVTEVI
jgi:hypothetical protein